MIEKTKTICLLSCLLGLDDSHSLFYADTLSSLGYPLQLVCPGEIPESLGGKDILKCQLPLPTYHFNYNSNIFHICAGLWQRLKNSMIAYRCLKILRPNIVFCTQPDSWLIAILAKMRLRNKVVVDLREIYEDRASAFPGFLQPLVRRAIRSLLRKMTRFTDEIIHVSKARQEFYSYLGKPGVVISIFPRLEKMPPRKKRDDSNINIVHAGGLRWSYASEELLEAIPLVLKQEPKACFTVIGDARSNINNSALMKQLQDKGNLIIYPNLSHDEVLKQLAISNIGLNLVLPVDQTHILAMPRKLFEYLAAGIPVVGSDMPTIKEVIEGNNCGVLVDARSPESIANGILLLCKDSHLRELLGNNGQVAANLFYNAESETTKIQSLLERITSISE